MAEHKLEVNSLATRELDVLRRSPILKQLWI
jgi:hypothetical protein